MWESLLASVAASIFAGLLAWTEKRRPDRQKSRALEAAKLRLEFLEASRRPDVSKLPPLTRRKMIEAQRTIESELATLLDPFLTITGRRPTRRGSVSRWRLLTLLYPVRSFVDVLLRGFFLMYLGFYALLLLGAAMAYSEGDFSPGETFLTIGVMTVPLLIAYLASVLIEWSRRDDPDRSTDDSADDIFLPDPEISVSAPHYLRSHSDATLQSGRTDPAHTRPSRERAG